jgi:hypothetical protein
MQPNSTSRIVTLKDGSQYEVITSKANGGSDNVRVLAKPDNNTVMSSVPMELIDQIADDGSLLDRIDVDSLKSRATGLASGAAEAAGSALNKGRGFLGKALRGIGEKIG